MKKLNLNLDELTVESFETGPDKQKTRGTVKGNYVSHCNPPVCDTDQTYDLSCRCDTDVSDCGTCNTDCGTCNTDCGSCYTDCGTCPTEVNTCNICPTDDPRECPSVIPHHC